MIALDSALVIVMAELLLAMVILAGILFFISKKKRDKEISEINQFITQLEEQALIRNEPLDKLLRETCGLDTTTVKKTLENINSTERELMQKVIQLFLQRDTLLLNEIDHCVGSLSESYCQLMSRVGQAPTGVADDNHSLERINQQLIRQLDTAMQTIDEISAEYTRVFSGSQSGLELENSSKRMLQIYHDSIQHLRQKPEE
ncbi:MAG: hypothetical protein ACU836_06145 [Gammaproteobacteria bacterium]